MAFTVWSFERANRFHCRTSRARERRLSTPLPVRGAWPAVPPLAGRREHSRASLVDQPGDILKHCRVSRLIWFYLTAFFSFFLFTAFGGSLTWAFYATEQSAIGAKLRFPWWAGVFPLSFFGLMVFGCVRRWQHWNQLLLATQRTYEETTSV